MSKKARSVKNTCTKINHWILSSAVEQLFYTEKVVGSIPTGSTIPSQLTWWKRRAENAEGLVRNQRSGPNCESGGMVYAADLKSVALGHTGSSPVSRTKIFLAFVQWIGHHSSKVIIEVRFLLAVPDYVGVLLNG